jgi:hypothetical protein
MYGFDTVDYEREDEYLRATQNEPDPIFFDTQAMTTFPHYHTHTLTSTQSRSAGGQSSSDAVAMERFSPYRGYFEDLRRVTATSNQEPAPSLINSYLKKSWVEHSHGVYVGCVCV